MAKSRRTSISNHHKNNYLDVTKRKKGKISTHSNWSSMPFDLLDKILNSLEELKDKVQVKYTCSSWFSITESHIRTFIETKRRNSPMLFISLDFEDEIDKRDFVFSLEEKLEKPLLHNVPLNSYSIGSSSGWILMLGEFRNLFIFHPTFGLKISLPPIESFPGFDYHPETLPKHYIKKFTLFFEKDFGVAVIHGRRNTIAFFKNGDTKWTEFDDSGEDYSDIIYHDDSIFALTDSLHVEVYKLFDVPTKVMEVMPSFPNNITEFKKRKRDLYSSQSYLVESRGDLLAVVRCIGNFVYGDDEVIREEDLIEEPYNSDVCPYKTTNFYVYKLNLEKIAWEELTNLDDQMLFIGGNQSFSLSAKNYVWGKENSIYFTDDNWLEITMAEDAHDFGGHDLGIFCLTKRRFEDIYVPDTGKVEPAFWIREC